MTDVLGRIEVYKREEIAAAKLRVSPAEIEKRAAAAPPARGFCKAIDAHLAAGRPALIAEVKKASPSKGLSAPISTRHRWRRPMRPGERPAFPC